MATFNVTRNIRIIVKGINTSVIPNAQGIPVAVTTPGKEIELKPGNNEIKDPEIIERIRSDIKFGIPDGIIEVTEEDKRAVKIREKKMKEADEEINSTKK